MKNDQEELEFYRISKFDIIFIVLIIVLSASSIIGVTFSHFQQSQQPKVALVYQADKLLEKVNLEKDGLIPVLNGKMQLKVKNGRIRVLKADCLQQICVNMGWIQFSGQIITCVPNKVSIEIKPQGAPVLDAVSY